jgi:hypothetical protein
MSLFSNYRADRLIAEIKASGNPNGPETLKAIERLVSIGPSAIDPLIIALATAEKRETVIYVDVLSRLIDVKSLPQLFKSMSEANGRAMSGIAWALSSSKNYPPGSLLEALSKPGMPKQAILDVIAAQKSRFTVRELLNAAYAQESTERAGLFKIIGEIADESSVDDLIARIEGKDPIARLHIINVLGRFNNAESAAGGASAAQGQQQADSIRGADGAQRAWTARSIWPCFAGCCGIRKSRCRTRPSMWWCAPIIPTPSSTWSRCSRTRTSTRGARRSRC